MEELTHSTKCVQGPHAPEKHDPLCDVRNADRVPTHLKKSFSILFQYLFNTKLKNFDTITSLDFSKFLTPYRPPEPL